MVFGHSVAGHRETGEHPDRVKRHQRVDRSAGEHQQRHRQCCEREDPVREHQPITALHELARQKAVLGNETRQRGKTVEAGVGAGVQDGRGRYLNQDIHAVADDPVAENRSGNLGEHRRILAEIRRGMSGVGKIADTGQQEPQNAGHRGEHSARVDTLRLTEDVDGVGNGFYPGQRRATIGERPQHHQDCRAHHQTAAVMHRYRSGSVAGIVLRKAPNEMPDNAGHDHHDEHHHKRVGGDRKRQPGFAQSAQIQIADEQYDCDGDLHAVGPQRRQRRRHRNRARRRLHCHCHDVVDQQCRGRHLRHLGPEVLPRHDVGAAGLRVNHHDLPVRRGHQGEDQQDHTHDGQQQDERREPGMREQLRQDLLGTVGGGRDRVGRKRAQRNGVRQPFVGQLLGDQRLAQEDALDHVGEGRRYVLLVDLSCHDHLLRDSASPPFDRTRCDPLGPARRDQPVRYATPRRRAR